MGDVEEIVRQAEKGEKGEDRGKIGGGGQGRESMQRGLGTDR